MFRYIPVVVTLLLIVPAIASAQFAGTPAPNMIGAEYQTATPGETQAPAALPQPTAPSASMATSEGNFNPCADCTVLPRTGPWQQLWLRGSYAFWNIGDGPLNLPLMTTGAGELPGVIGDPSTVVLFGDKIDFGTFQGFTLQGGLWLDQQHLHGIGFGLQLLGERTNSATFSSNGFDGILLSRPFFDSTQNLPLQNSIVQVSTADGRAGTFNVTNQAEVGGFDVHYLRNLCYDSNVTINGLVGYRYFLLKEKLDMVQFSQTLSENAQPLLLDNIEVESLLLRDSFHTKNQINGVEVGLQGEVNWGVFFVGGTTRVTLGVNQQTLNINGSTAGPDGTTFEGGLLALSPNIGQNRENQFIIMPELNGYVGVQVSRHVRLQVGYDWLYINNVIRPGSQIDSSINQRYLPSSQFFNDLSGPVVPRVTQVKNDFVASGISFGLEVQY